MALIKCPECHKDISDIVKKCPQCGYKIKKETNNKLFKILKENKKIQILIGVLMLIIIITIVALNLINADKKNAKKMTKHLESIGYQCSFNKEEELYNCNRINGTKKEVMEVRYYMSEYTLESKNEYTMSISSNQYKYGFNPDVKVVKVTNLHNEEYSCWYVPTSFNGERYEFVDDNRWTIGDNSIGYADTFGEDKCQYDYSDKVDKMLREFESYYKGAGLTLQD